MAKSPGKSSGARTKGRGRERSRKRRPAGGAAVVDAPEPTTSEQEAPKAKSKSASERRRAGRRRQEGREPRPFKDPQSAGPRPPAPWHPWPLSELLILVGAVGTVVGLIRLSHGGISNGGPVLFAGLGAVALGTFEVALREHRAGYRSHTLMLAFLPVLVFHTVVVLGVSALTSLSTTDARLLNVGLFAVDLAIFAVLFKLLRARFADARARVVSRG